jgi:hypothetical protein
MDWKRKDELGEDGNPTPLALALRALSENGCDCDDSPGDEPGTCCVCRCEAALEYLVEKLDSLEERLKHCLVVEL